MALHSASVPIVSRLFTSHTSFVLPTFRSRTAILNFRQLPPLLQLALPVSIALNIPSLLSGIWESILKAVPKKKTSHMKKRHRFMAGKALKDVINLNKCSACGNVKRAHFLCPYCVREIRDNWLGRSKQKEGSSSSGTTQLEAQ